MDEVAAGKIDGTMSVLADICRRSQVGSISSPVQKDQSDDGKPAGKFDANNAFNVLLTNLRQVRPKVKIYEL